MSVQYNKRKISELVAENYVYASVLYYFGIEFYNYSEKTLEQACSERGLQVRLVVDSLERVSKKEQQDVSLINYPIDLIIEYLKHAHYIFVKKKLPYLAKMISELDTKKSGHQAVITDIKFIFPIFVEDFIHHIYEEEDNLFYYIQILERSLREVSNPGELFYNMEKFSIQRYATEHEAHDDEMAGIRRITNNYKTSQNMDAHLRVLYAELKDFENSLITHAKVENEILFPRALTLENEIKRKVQSITPLN